MLAELVHIMKIDELTAKAARLPASIYRPVTLPPEVYEERRRWLRWLGLADDTTPDEIESMVLYEVENCLWMPDPCAHPVQARTKHARFGKRGGVAIVWLCAICGDEVPAPRRRRVWQYA